MGVHYLFLLLLLSKRSFTESAFNGECSNNFTRLENFKNPSRLGTVVTLPRDERNTIGQFIFVQWLFPNIQFGCNGNLSRIVVRANTTVGESPPLLFIWEEGSFVDQNQVTYQRVTMGCNGTVAGKEDLAPVTYTFEPPLEITDEQFVGFQFEHNGTDIISYTIAFLDAEEENASVSLHSFLGLGILFDPSPTVRRSNQYIPVMLAEFIEPEVTASTIPPLTTTPSTPTATTPVTSSSTPTPTRPSRPSQPSQPQVVDIGLIAGIVVAVLLLILIVLLTVIIALVVTRSRSQKKIYEEPVEPIQPTLDNPVYGGNGNTSQTELVNGNNHIYATPSPVTSPHPPQESQLTFSNGSSTHQHYEFAEGYVPSTNEPNNGVEPVSTADPDYAQPEVSIQPYEVPLSALQQVTQNVPQPTESSDQQTTTEPIYSVLEEGIYVPTQEERKPYPYSEATIINGTMANNDSTAIYSELGKKYQGSLQRDGFFQEEDIYWRPASSEVALYDQLSKRKYREIVRQKIQIIKHLGSGQFGTVNMGVWQTSTQSVDVAVKTLQPMASETDKVKFLQEAAIMGQFLHPNVVKLYGVVTVGEPVMIVLEYMDKGDLRNYLLSKRPQPGELVPDDLSQTLLRFCREIASGMNYLANKAFVHRDLAARNILLSSETTCKIGDFGMSRDLEQSNYYITHGGIIPVKWTSPEALNFRKYSTASDVWSFGCVMFEIWSLGHKPFEGFTNLQCMQLVGSGFRLAPPPGCPRPLYELMIRCWHSDYTVRPTFSAIFNMLSHSPSHLLSWSERDLKVHPQVSCLGASLEVSEELYPELQDYYIINRKSKKSKGSNTADW